MIGFRAEKIRKGTRILHNQECHEFILRQMWSDQIEKQQRGTDSMHQGDQSLQYFASAKQNNGRLGLTLNYSLTETVRMQAELKFTEVSSQTLQ
jgi:hypothetical protein